MVLLKRVCLVSCILTLLSPKSVTADHANQRPADSTASLSPNAVPMMGKKDAAPRDVPSFTSGYLPPAFPRFMSPSKRLPSPSPSWHLRRIELTRPGQSQPTIRTKRDGDGTMLHTSSWLGSLLKPHRTGSESGKRSARPTGWSSPWYNRMGSSPGFRFHQEGSDLFNRNLMYKRTADGPIQDSEPFTNYEQEYRDYGGLMDEVNK